MAEVPGPAATPGLERAGGSGGRQPLTRGNGAGCGGSPVRGWSCLRCPPGPALSPLAPHFSLSCCFLHPPTGLLAGKPRSWHCIFRAVIFRGGVRLVGSSPCPPWGTSDAVGSWRSLPAEEGRKNPVKIPCPRLAAASFSPSPRCGQSGLFYMGSYRHAAGNYTSSRIKDVMQMHLQVN